MTDTPPHIALAIERVKEIANGANKITEAELQSLCDLAIKALTHPPPGQYDELVGRLSRRSQTHNTGRAVGAGDGATHTMGYYDAYCAKDDGEAAAAITNLQQQVRDARGNALEEAAELAKGRHQHWSMPHPDDAKPGEVCDDISACADIATAILALKDKRT